MECSSPIFYAHCQVPQQNANAPKPVDRLLMLLESSYSETCPVLFGIGNCMPPFLHPDGGSSRLLLCDKMPQNSMKQPIALTHDSASLISWSYMYMKHRFNKNDLFGFFHHPNPVRMHLSYHCSCKNTAFSSPNDFIKR